MIHVPLEHAKAPSSPSSALSTLFSMLQCAAQGWPSNPTSTLQRQRPPMAPTADLPLQAIALLLWTMRLPSTSARQVVAPRAAAIPLPRLPLAPLSPEFDDRLDSAVPWMSRSVCRPPCVSLPEGCRSKQTPCSRSSRSTIPRPLLHYPSYKVQYSYSVHTDFAENCIRHLPCPA